MTAPPDERHPTMRILMVTPRSPLGQGGVERHVMEVGRRFAAAGAAVEVLCADPAARGPTQDARDGLVIRAVRAWPSRRDYYFAPALWREMARARWDVVHVQSYHTLVAPLAMLRALTLGIPYVVTFHGGGHSSSVRHALRTLQRRALRPLLARAERLVALAPFEIEQYGRELGLGPERFVLIPNGTDLVVDDGPRPAPPATLDSGSGGVLLASIGRLERYKGHHRVIAALPHVRERRPGARLMIVGTGPYEDALRRQAAQLGVEDHVSFTSVPANDGAAMAGLLRRVSLVVLLSDFETHPLVALEAAAAGCRLLVADTSGLGDIARDGIARTIAPGESPPATAAAILEALAAPPPAGTPTLSSWDECAHALLGLYAAIVARAGSGAAQTPAERREHFEIERELASRLRGATSQAERRALYADVYRQRSERISHHPLVRQAADPAARTAAVAPQVALLRPFLAPAGTFCEIGAGDGAVARQVAPLVGRAIALDVTDALALPDEPSVGFEFRVFDGFDLGLPDGSLDVVYSNDVVEHLHPDDAADQAAAICRALRPGGVYVCVTPNRLSGPHDISRHFAATPQGFHLREYTATELAGVFRRAGFAGVKAVLTVRGRRLSPLLPVALLRPVETLLGGLPRPMRRFLARGLAAAKVVAVKHA